MFRELLARLRLVQRRFVNFAAKTTAVNIFPFRRIPRIQEVADKLRDYLDRPEFSGREFTLIGHSMGGLIISCYLENMLFGERQCRPLIRQLIFFATPFAGSGTLSL